VQKTEKQDVFNRNNHNNNQSSKYFQNRFCEIFIRRSVYCAFFLPSKETHAIFGNHIFILFQLYGYCGQTNLKIFVEKEDDRKVFYAQNNEFCPVSVELTLELDNMATTGFANGVFVIPEYAQKYKLFELTGIKPRRKTSYSYSYSAVFGDVFKTNYDENYRYDLPYKKGHVTG
jgi:hypothetical protein